MTYGSCPACGATLDADAVRCAECGAGLSGRKRGEAAGVRLDPNRVDRALGDLGREARGGWGGSTSRSSLRAEPDPEAGVESASRGTRPDAVVMETTVRAEPAPKVTDAAPTERPRSIPPAAPVPLDAEVVLDMADPPDTSQTIRTATETRVTVSHGRPPVLASEALLRDLAPAKPAPTALRYVAASIGLLGALLVAVLTGTERGGVPFEVALVALALLSLPPMPYAARAASVVTVSGSGLLLAVATHPDAAARRLMLLLLVPITLLGTGLFFRAFHRASALARALVVLGITAGIVFLVMSGALSNLTMTDTAWQSWMPRLIGVPFGMLLMLSLLAFMDARTTAGSAIWGTCVLVFHALYTYLALLREMWPKGATSPDLSRVRVDVLVAELCTPMFTALLVLGLAQVLSSTMAHAIGQAERKIAQRPT
jgi:hypothetical protein